MKNFYKILIILFLVIIDQFTKFFAISILSEKSIEVFSFFNLLLAFNRGVAFSLVVPFDLLLFSSVVFLGWVLWWLFYQKHSFIEKIGLICVVSGGFGNFIDRIFRGEVVDFLSFWSFPVFNFADTFISIGIVLILFSQFNGKKELDN